MQAKANMSHPQNLCRQHPAQMVTQKAKANMSHPQKMNSHLTTQLILPHPRSYELKDNESTQLKLEAAEPEAQTATHLFSPSATPCTILLTDAASNPLAEPACPARASPCRKNQAVCACSGVDWERAIAISGCISGCYSGLSL